MSPVSVYIHFPYCLYKCHYCDFNSYATKPETSLFERYVDGIERELAHRLETGAAFAAGSPLTSLFIGGGTPSLLEPTAIARIIKFIKDVYPLSSGHRPREGEAPGSLADLEGATRAPTMTCEVTVECNPKTLSPEKIQDLRSAGVTRLSIGVQSFHDAYLAPLGRIHSGQEAWDTLATVSRSGFAAVNTDLMFGFPGQSLDEVLADVREAAQFGFSHLSLYSLTAEPATPFFREVREGRVALPPLDFQHTLMTEAWVLLESLGFRQYEVSNFYREKGGAPCRHNLRYWDYAPFLGLGAGATGFLHDAAPTPKIWAKRYTNVRAPEAYLEGVMKGSYCAEEPIAEATAVNEWFMMGLRKIEGIRVAEFGRLFPSRDFDADYGKRCAQLEKRGLLVSERGYIRASRRGLEILDGLIGQFWL